MKNTQHETLTGGCCQWRGSPSYDSDEHIETAVLRGKYSIEPPNSTPPERYQQADKTDCVQ